MLTSNTCTSRRACVENRGDGLKPVKMIDLSERKPDVGTARVCRIVAIVAFFAVCTFFLGCTSSADSKQQKAQAAGPRAISVATAPVQRQDVPVYLSGLGAVTAFNTANIKSRVDGQIMKVNVREGQNVKQGELLIELDSRPFQVQLDQMQAQLSRDQAQLRDAQLNLQRYTSLIPSGSIAQQQGISELYRCRFNWASRSCA